MVDSAALLKAFKRNQRRAKLLVVTLASLCGLCGTQTQVSFAQSLPLSPLQLTAQRANTPSNSPATSASTTATERTPEDIDAQQQDIQVRLTATQAELLKTQQAHKELTSLDTTARLSVTAHLESLRQRADAYTQIIDNIKNLSRLSNKLTIARKEKLDWKPPSGTAPWPLSVGDDLQFELMHWQRQVQHLAQRDSISDEQISELKKSRATAEIEARQIKQKNDAQTQTTSLTARDLNAPEQRLSRLNLELVNLSIDKDAIQIEQLTAALLASSLKQTWDAYAYRFVFSAEDFNKVSANLEKSTGTLRAQEKQASARINRTLDQVASAKARLDQLESTANTSAEALLTARRGLRAADIQAEAARIERERYRTQLDLNFASLQIWGIRYKIYSSTDITSQLNTLRLEHQALTRQVDQGLNYLTQAIAEKSQWIFDLTTQIQQAKDPIEQAFLNGLLTPMTQQIDLARNLYVVIGRAQQYLKITEAEIDHVDNNKTLLQQLKVARALITSTAREIWHYELLAIDDTMVVDGREIKTKRSITIGKSVGAIAILIFGFMLISGLIRRTLALAVNKAHLGASKSVVLGRWLTLIAGFTLILTAFNLVDIPLSAFAFLGGALAIGVGFGTQNILKNLISGVMLLIEKPIRIGDLVEIDGIVGTVTSIGIRFSTVHGPQGNDTLIPNSVLVEQKLVNWTYSTPNARKDVRVTVGYRSNVETVRQILVAVSHANPNIISTPSPLITLDDFGDNGLVFNVQFWVSLHAGITIREIQSNLRIKILEALAAAEIELPYPQRTVLFDQDTPLSVQIHPSVGVNTR